MKQLAMSNFTDIHFTLIALCLFLGSFLLVLVMTFSKYNQKKFQELSKLPLDIEPSINGAQNE